MESAREFLGMYSLPVPRNLAEFSHYNIVNFISQIPSDKRERASKFSIGHRTLDIRSTIERLRAENLSPEDQGMIGNLYGEKVTYKCPKVWCDYFSMGFNSNEDRQKHVDSHDRQFRCLEGGCFAFRLGYPRKSDLEEHAARYHGTMGETPQFPKAIGPKDNDTLLKAAGRNDLDAIIAFLESGVPVDGISISSRGKIENRFPICRAVKYGHVEACRLLLDRGANWRDFENAKLDCMSLAIEHRQLDVLQGLLNWPDVEITVEHLESLILQACELAQPDTVRMLFGSSHFRSSDIDVWKEYARGWTSAVCEKSFDDPDFISIIEQLLENGFSRYFSVENLSQIKDQGGEYLVGLLQPMIDLAEDYKMQLKLLEDINKGRLMIARQNQDRG